MATTVTRADENGNSEPQTRAITFAAWVESGEFIGTEQLRRLYVSVGTNQVGFLVPNGLRVDISRADRVTLMAPDLSYFLTLRIIGNDSAAQVPSEGLRRQALQHFPGALLTDESSAEAGGRRGPIFNLRWKPAGGVDRVITLAFIPNAAGVLEFSVVSDHGKSPEAQSALVGLLQRLQSSEGGRLRMETFRPPDYN